MISRKKTCWACGSDNYKRRWNGGQAPRLYYCLDCGAESRPVEEYLAARATALAAGLDPMCGQRVQAIRCAARQSRTLAALPKADRFRAVYLRTVARLNADPDDPRPLVSFRAAARRRERRQ